MLHSLERLIGATVAATDGKIGEIRGFLFDDRSWTVRYLVVDVGNWLARKDVIIPVSSAGPADWDHRKIPVRLTREQVRRSPDVDTEKPVSRRQDEAMRAYYGWPAYGDDTEFGPLSVIPPGRDFANNAGEESHLRGARGLEGYHVWSPEGEVGLLETFILDDGESWHVGYLVVKTGDWLHRRPLLIPTRWVDSVSWANRRVDLRSSIEKTRASSAGKS